MEYKNLLIEKDGAIDWVTFNRPDNLNALSRQMVRELNHYFGSLENNYDVRVVVLKGNGRAFCAGLDMKDPERPLDSTTNTGMKSQRNFSGIVMRMRRCPQPIIGLLHGYAAGGGFSIALGCDVRIAAEGTKMNCAFIKIGLSGCEMGASYHLPRLVGTSVAAELLMTGRFIDANRALRTGLVSDVVPMEELVAAGKSLADDMIATAPLGLRMTKECFWANVDGNDLNSAIAMEDRNQILAVSNGDVAEGIKSFLEKRKPNYAS
ncbi:enoyl-CoA hydratase/isomerase family protein [Iodidimonas sp. SYSU 1G8]|uniref:enoyl-CoA hydratase/isomerase family protein n=1 Tax=Iodidimonas sp. SYSU 1G8 TaxID=3133967 RepID=UPI0031FF0C82